MLTRRYLGGQIQPNRRVPKYKLNIYYTRCTQNITLDHVLETRKKTFIVIYTGRDDVVIAPSCPRLLTEWREVMHDKHPNSSARARNEATDQVLAGESDSLTTSTLSYIPRSSSAFAATALSIEHHSSPPQLESTDHVRPLLPGRADDQTCSDPTGLDSPPPTAHLQHASGSSAFLLPFIHAPPSTQPHPYHPLLALCSLCRPDLWHDFILNVQRYPHKRLCSSSG